MRRLYECCSGTKRHAHDCAAAEFFGMAREAPPTRMTPERAYREAVARGCTDEEARRVAEELGKS